MATVALIHGLGDVGWYRHLVERELRERGHEVLWRPRPGVFGRRRRIHRREYAVAGGTPDDSPPRLAFQLFVERCEAASLRASETASRREA
jgi:hypothetical protein